jgi:hypothetical protein
VLRRWDAFGGCVGFGGMLGLGACFVWGCVGFAGLGGYVGFAGLGGYVGCVGFTVVLLWSCVSRKNSGLFQNCFLNGMAGLGLFK